MHYCTACHKQEATVTITDLTDGEVVGHRHLCTACAEATGAVGGKPQLKLSPEILEDLLGTKPKGGRESRSGRDGCPGCGTTVAEFKTKGRLGCPRCYETFRASLVPLLQRIHEAASHRGRLPGRSASKAPATAAEPDAGRRLAELRRRLEDAVRGERYEEAAGLRDQLRQAEQPEPAEGRGDDDQGE